MGLAAIRFADESAVMLRDILKSINIHQGLYTLFLAVFRPKTIYLSEAKGILKPIPYAFFAIGLSVFLYVSIGNETRSTWFDAMSNINFNKMALEDQQRLFGYLDISIEEWNRYIERASTQEEFFRGLNRLDHPLDSAVRAKHGTIFADEIASRMIDDGYGDVAAYFFAGKAESDRINSYMHIAFYMMFVVGIAIYVAGFMPVVGYRVATRDVFIKTVYVNSTLAVLYGIVSIMEFFSAPLNFVDYAHKTIQYGAPVLGIAHFRYVQDMTIIKMIIGFIVSIILFLAVMVGGLAAIEALLA